MTHSKPPEPCLSGRCRSPLACHGWGYCRERNAGRDAGRRALEEWRQIAAERRALAEPDRSDER